MTNTYKHFTKQDAIQIYKDAIKNNNLKIRCLSKEPGRTYNGFIFMTYMIDKEDCKNINSTDLQIVEYGKYILDFLKESFNNQYEVELDFLHELYWEKEEDDDKIGIEFSYYIRDNGEITDITSKWM